MRRRRLGGPADGVLLAALLVLAGCGEDERPAFPATYATSFTEVRNCRRSADHELAFIRVLADAAALGPYDDRTSPFPNGAVVLKEEYDAADPSCTGPIAGWTVMVADERAEDELGWRWQRVDDERRVQRHDRSCAQCHRSCAGGSEVGYAYTCADP